MLNGWRHPVYRLLTDRLLSPAERLFGKVCTKSRLNTEELSNSFRERLNIVELNVGGTEIKVYTERGCLPEWHPTIPPLIRLSPVAQTFHPLSPQRFSVRGE